MGPDRQTPQEIVDEFDRVKSRLSDTEAGHGIIDSRLDGKEGNRASEGLAALSNQRPEYVSQDHS